jgi:hypothetical protein
MDALAGRNRVGPTIGGAWLTIRAARKRKA